MDVGLLAQLHVCKVEIGGMRRRYVLDKSLAAMEVLMPISTVLWARGNRTGYKFEHGSMRVLRGSSLWWERLRRGGLTLGGALEMGMGRRANAFQGGISSMQVQEQPEGQDWM